jgi:tRNA G18 (ribose-2'-O)-methylase SpoU
MAVQRLTGLDDPRVVDYRDIAEHDLVRSRGLFVAEGRLVVRRLIEERRHTLRSLLLNDASYRSLEPQLASLADTVPIWICETRDFLGITGYDLHRGCLALVERPPALSVRDLLASVRPPLIAATRPLTTVAPPRVTIIVLEGVTNPDNVGGVFRNAAAFGAAGVLLDPACCDPLYRKSIRTSMAAVLRVPFAHVDAWRDDLGTLRELGFTIAALTPRTPAVTRCVRRLASLARRVAGRDRGGRADARRRVGRRLSRADSHR